MNNRMYLWISIGAAAGALMAVVIPGLDVAFGIPIGIAVGIAAAERRRRTGRR